MHVPTVKISCNAGLLLRRSRFVPVHGTKVVNETCFGFEHFNVVEEGHLSWVQAFDVEHLNYSAIETDMEPRLRGIQVN